MKPFTAFRINRDADKNIHASFQDIQLDDLTAGEVIIEVQWSGINYKDALAATGKGQILRSYPLNGGIDLTGLVIESSDERFAVGDEVLACGGGLSEVYDGGYAQIARLPASILTKIPAGLCQKEVITIGTAGLAAALAVIKLERNGQVPEMGPVLVTGATGGVGCIAIDILSKRGFEVAALTGKAEHNAFLTSLGATEIIDRHTLEISAAPMSRALWGGAIDNLGANVLSWLCATVRPEGSIASIGLAAGFKLNTTVLPFILRGVSLLGVNSVELTPERRADAWARLATDLKPQHLDNIIAKEIDFKALPNAFDDLINSQQIGRTIVKIA
ncbi:MAG: acryloyl-CoA reductase [Arenicellales bacterium]